MKTITPKDWPTLSGGVQDALEAHLKEAGIPLNRTKLLELHEDRCIATVYKVDENDRLYWDAESMAPAVEVIELLSVSLPDH